MRESLDVGQRCAHHDAERLRQRAGRPHARPPFPRARAALSDALPQAVVALAAIPLEIAGRRGEGHARVESCAPMIPRQHHVSLRIDLGDHERRTCGA